MEEPKFMRIENGWYIFKDNDEMVMIPPSRSQMLVRAWIGTDGFGDTDPTTRTTTVRSKHLDITGEWMTRCMAINKKEVTK
jgi:hypothetical protein